MVWNLGVPGSIPTRNCPDGVPLGREHVLALNWFVYPGIMKLVFCRFDINWYNAETPFNPKNVSTYVPMLICILNTINLATWGINQNGPVSLDLSK